MRWFLCVAFVCLVLSSGCSKKETTGESVARDEKAVPPVVEQDPAQDPLFIIDELVMEGDVDGALELLEDIINDDMYESERAWLFHKLLFVIAENHGLNAAQERYLKVFALDDNDELVRGGFEVIYSLLQESEDWKGVLAWSDKIAGFEVPEDLEARGFQWQMRALKNQGDFDSLLALLPVCMETFESHTAVRLLSGVIRPVLASGDYELAEKILDVVEENSGDDQAFLVMSKVMRIESRFLAGQWEDGLGLFKEHASSIPDRDLRICFSRIAQAMSAAGQHELFRETSVFVIEDLSDKPETRNRAAFQFMGAVAKHDGVSGVIDGLRKIIRHDLPQQTLVRLCAMHFYPVIRDGSREEHFEMLSVCEEMLPMLQDEKQIGQLKLIIFDGAFVVGDYERAENVLTSGIPDQEPGWEEMALNKLKAHKALDEGNAEEAVKRFRKFMEYVESDWTKPVHNPLTGMLYTKSMSLGFNAARIGDILAEAGNADAAGDAYSEAIRYYNEALKETLGNPEEQLHIKQVIAEIQAKSGG